PLHEVREGRIDLPTGTGAKDFDWKSKRRSARLQVFDNGVGNGSNDAKVIEGEATPSLRAPTAVKPKVFEAIGRHFGVAHRVLDVFVPEVVLQGPRVVAIVGEPEPTGVAKHVEVDRKWHLGGFADALDQAMEADGTDWPAALGNEYVSPFGVLAAQLTQSPHLVTPDGMHAGLRPHRERPCRSAAEQRDKVASLHSITSSARASSAGGTVTPSALAVLRLITSSYLVGACTGNSAGFSPLRMRLMYPAARRYGSTGSGP